VEAMSEQEIDKAIAMLAEELIDDLLQTSDEELLTEALEDSKSISAALGNIRAEIDTAINGLGKDRLAEARAAIARTKQDQPPHKFDASQVRKQVAEILSSKAGRAHMTLAARNGQALSEKEILSAFSDLCELQGFEKSVPRHNFGNSPKAEYILQNLGVTEPGEIDVEAIAWHLGAKVRYERLDHCEARIVGAEDAAIITVNEKVSRQRQRFSICHELGHWIYHRRRMLLCQADEIERPSVDSANLERVADRFASELLMPKYLFDPIAESLGRPNMHVVRKLSEIFNTSQTATAIRLVERNQLPLVLVNYGKGGRRWFTRSQSVNKDWMPNTDLGSASSAFNMIFAKGPQAMPPRSVSASTWFSRWDASRFELIEESLRVAAAEVLTLLTFKNAHDFMRYSQG
jgi:IrrE N-terminal-like domain